MERLHLMRILKETGGKKMQAARILGIDIKTLNVKIKRYRIPL
jgi:transcriptional regulator with GAF, ATPase, and Fis domain